MQVRVQPEEVRVKPGQQVHLTCVLDERTPPGSEMIWFRLGDEPLPLGTVVEGFSIVFTALSESDAGSYLCGINGAHGIGVVYVEGY